MEKIDTRKIDFGHITRFAFNWACKVTFSHFSLKKIFILAFIAWLGAGLQGCNIPFWPQHNIHQEDTVPINPGRGIHKKNSVMEPVITVNDPNSKKTIEKAPIPANHTIAPAPTGKHFDLNYSLYPAAIGLVVFVITLIVAIMFVCTWISARFSFIFLDDIIKNDASIHQPFYRYKHEGNSLFVFNFLWGAALLVALCAIIVKITTSQGFDSFPTGVTISMIKQNALLSIAFLVIAIIGILFFTITYDFIVPIMYYSRIKIIPAWKIVLSILKKNKKNTILYLVLKLGLTACAITFAVIAYLIATAIIALIGLSCGLIFYAVGQLAIKAIPFVAYFFYALAIVTGIILLFTLFILLLIVMVPVAIFFRIFSIKFIENADSNYNFFSHQDSHPVACDA